MFKQVSVIFLRILKHPLMEVYQNEIDLNVRGQTEKQFLMFVYTIEANTTLTTHISSKLMVYNIGYLLFNRTTVSRRGGWGERGGSHEV